jgi:hypothetical protein
VQGISFLLLVDMWQNASKTAIPSNIKRNEMHFFMLSLAKWRA